MMLKDTYKVLKTLQERENEKLSKNEVGGFRKGLLLSYL